MAGRNEAERLKETRLTNASSEAGRTQMRMDTKPEDHSLAVPETEIRSLGRAQPRSATLKAKLAGARPKSHAVGKRRPKVGASR